jgi:hypothetical protein
MGDSTAGCGAATSFVESESAEPGSGELGRLVAKELSGRAVVIALVRVAGGRGVALTSLFAALAVSAGRRGVDGFSVGTPVCGGGTDVAALWTEGAGAAGGAITIRLVPRHHKERNQPATRSTRSATPPINHVLAVGPETVCTAGCKGAAALAEAGCWAWVCLARLSASLIKLICRTCPPVREWPARPWRNQSDVLAARSRRANICPRPR